jgi:hypothetical protein
MYHDRYRILHGAAAGGATGILSNARPAATRLVKRSFGFVLRAGFHGIPPEFCFTNSLGV